MLKDHKASFFLSLKQTGIVLSVLIFVISALFIFTPVTRADITTGLVGYWKFDTFNGTTTLATVGGFTAVLSNGAASTTGRIGQAVSLDGVDDYVNLGSTPSSMGILANGSYFAISIWFKSSTTTRQVILGRTTNSSLGRITIDLNGNTSGVTAEGKIAATIGLSNANRMYVDTTSTSTFNDNNWHHLVINFDLVNKTSELYLDGNSKALTYGINSLTSSDTGSWTTTGSIFYGALSNNVGTPSSFVTGALDELRIYNGRTLSSSEVSTLYNVDTTNPIISSIASSTTSTTATITWTTDEVASSSVSYGATSSYGNASTSASLVTSHSITLSALAPATVYHFQVSSTDASGNTATSSDYTFTTGGTADVTPPVISSVTASSSASSASITWTTDEVATSKVSYGTISDTYTTSTSSLSLVTSHSLSFTDLDAETTYYYVVVSTDSTGNTATSTEETFTTTAYGLNDLLLAHYTFDAGAVTDVSGNGNNGSLTGGTSFVSGVINNAIRVSGASGAQIQIPASNTSSVNVLGDFTYSLWVKPESHVSNAAWFSRLTNFHIGTNNVGSGTNINFYAGGSPYHVGTYIDDEWMYLVGVYTASDQQMRAYKNNVLIGTSTVGVLVSGSQSLNIGNSAGQAGSFDDIRLYGRALSSEDIEILYEYGLSGGVGQLYNFNVIKTGTGSGTVTGTDISCGSDCFDHAPTGKTITLTATPSFGSTFSGWSGGGCSGTGSCIVTISNDVIVTATFTDGVAPSTGTTYTVIQGGGGDYTTIQSCANAVSPGDTCLVSSGTYNETFTPTVSGTYLLPIHIKAAPSATVNVNAVNLDSVDFVRLEDIKVRTITQWSISYIFDTYYETGLFANEDYWVKGPVTINEITPSATTTVSYGYHNGWEVNPVYTGPQGFDSRAGSFGAWLVPSLPYTAEPYESIVKGVSRATTTASCTPGNRPCLLTAGVLTIVPATLPDYGSRIMRPSYVGAAKDFVPVSALQTDLLPTYPLLSYATTTATLQNVKTRYQRVQLDHKTGDTGRTLHPLNNMEDYGRDIANSNNSAILRFMFNEAIEDKMLPLILFAQYGIDSYYTHLSGQRWQDQGGMVAGRRVMFAFNATILDHAGMREIGNTYTGFNEDLKINRSSVDGRALYGDDGSSGIEGEDSGGDATAYWGAVYSEAEGGSSGSRAAADPYGFIDGGPSSGGTYQSVLYYPYKGSALAAILMPEIQNAWNTDEVEAFIEYADRVVSFGAWAQPDPCAPVDQGGGEDGSDCVLDPDLTATSTMSNFQCEPGMECGRFPDRHGYEVGDDSTNLVNLMWTNFHDVGDVVSPVISSIASLTTPTTATITWITNEVTSSTVNYGLSTLYGLTSTIASLLTSHSIILSGLTPSTTYHFQVGGADAASNISLSSDRTFTTLASTQNSDSSSESSSVTGVPTNGPIFGANIQIGFDPSCLLGINCKETISTTTSVQTPTVNQTILYSFSRNLRANMIGEDVRQLQKYLNSKGFLLTPSGPGSPGNETNKFGALTFKALVRFQKSVGLPATGFFGPMTRGKILELSK